MLKVHRAKAQSLSSILKVSRENAPNKKGYLLIPLFIFLTFEF
jgi:hypothetical protein